MKSLCMHFQSKLTRNQRCAYPPAGTMRQIGMPKYNRNVMKHLCEGKYHPPHDISLLRQKGFRMACSAYSSDDKAAPGQSAQMNASAGHQRYAVIGGGFAGVAVAWHLLKHTSADSPVSVDLYDCEGLGGGGSGAAGGLLHPFTPRGKPLWRGDEGVLAAMELVDAAEKAAEPGTDPFVWRSGLLRPAKVAKHAKDFGKFCRTTGQEDTNGKTEEALWSSTVVSSSEAQRLVPGLSLAELRTDINEGGSDPESGSSKAGEDEEEEMPEAGLYVQQGVVLSPKRYLRALWRACESKCEAAGGPCRVRLVRQRVKSLEELRGKDQLGNGCGYSAIVVAAGAAVGAIAELRDVLPLHLSQGYTIDVVPGEGQPPYPTGSPSLLGNVYMSVQDGGKAGIIGATRNYGLSPEEALQEIGREVPNDLPEAVAACDVLLSQAEATWPPLASWEVKSVRTGVRALPPRTSAGSIPLAGRITLPTTDSDDAASPGCSCWVVGGLGARGLVYHAILASWLVDAIRHNDPLRLPGEVTSWQTAAERA